MQKTISHKLKIAGLVVALIPVTFFVIFAVGEGLGGDLSGLSHLIQATPFLFLGLIAWRRPFLGSWLLLALALFLVGINLAYIHEGILWVGSGIIAVSGLLFFLASSRENNKQRGLYAKNV